MREPKYRFDRRQLMIGGAALGLSSMVMASKGEIKMAQADELTGDELEVANETLVTNFCRDWSLRDADALEQYLAEDLYYQIAPGQPIIESYAQFKKQMGPFMTKMESIEWEVLRSHVIGPVVMNERIDHFNALSGQKSPSMRFHVVGHFLIEDGKIKVWKDWPIPGKEQFIG
jgi:limonene-1,2-epoxide hydrolase